MEIAAGLPVSQARMQSGNCLLLNKLLDQQI